MEPLGCPPRTKTPPPTTPLPVSTVVAKSVRPVRKCPPSPAPRRLHDPRTTADSRTERAPDQDRRGDALVVSRLRDVRHRPARSAGHPRRAEAGAAPYPLRDAADGVEPGHEIPKVRRYCR